MKIRRRHLGRRLLEPPDRGAPLTPYSPAYFYPEPGSGLFTYAADWLPALISGSGAANFQSGDLPLPAGVGQEQGLELAELLRFYRQPARYFLNRRLKVWFELEEVTIEDSEPFELDGLQHYQLKALLLDAHLTEGSTEVAPRLQPTGLLPQRVVRQPAAGGDRRREDGQAGGAAAPMDGDKQAVGDRHRPWPRASCRVDRHQKGRAGGQTRQLQWQGSAAGLDPAPLPLIGSAPATPCCSMPNRVCGCQGLRRTRRGPGWRPWWPCWTQGMKRPLPFFPSTAWDWGSIEEGSDKPEEADKAALARFNGGWMTGEVLIGDVHVARFPELDDEVLAQLQGAGPEHLTPLHQAWRS